LKSLLTELILIFSLSISVTDGFSQKSDKRFNPKIVTRDESGTKTIYPLVIAKFPEQEIVLDSLTLNQIDRKWIKKIEIHKDGENSNNFGRSENDGVVLIYFKKRKRKLAFETINSIRKTHHNNGEQP